MTLSVACRLHKEREQRRGDVACHGPVQPTQVTQSDSNSQLQAWPGRAPTCPRLNHELSRSKNNYPEKHFLERSNHIARLILRHTELKAPENSQLTLALRMVNKLLQA